MSNGSYSWSEGIHTTHAPNTYSGTKLIITGEWDFDHNDQTYDEEQHLVPSEAPRTKIGGLGAHA